MRKKQIKNCQIIFGTLIGLISSYLIYEALIPSKYSLAYNMTHYTVDRGIKEVKVKDVQINPHTGDFDKKALIVNDFDFHKLKYEVFPFNVTNPEVEITSSNDQILEIKGDEYRIKPHDYYQNQEPLEITVTSKENPAIFDKVRIKSTVTLAKNVTFTPGEGIVDIDNSTYEVEAYKPFKIDYQGVDDYNEPVSETAYISKLTNGIKQINKNWFYATKEADLAEIYIKAGLASTKVQIKVTPNTSFIEPESFKVTSLDGKNDTSELIVGNNYTVKTLKGNEVIKVPLTIKSENEKVLKIKDFTTLVPVDEGSADVTVKIEMPNGVTKDLKQTITVKHHLETPIIKLNHRFKKENLIVLNINETLRYNVDYVNSTYKDLKVTIENNQNENGENILEILPDRYIRAHTNGNVKVTIGPANESYADEVKPYSFNVHVLSQYFNANISENVVIALVLFVYAIIVTLFIFSFYWDKKYLQFLPITFAVGLVMVSLFHLLQLANPTANPTLILFSVNLVTYFIGAGLMYTILAIYRSYKGYVCERKYMKNKPEEIKTEDTKPEEITKDIEEKPSDK